MIAKILGVMLLLVLSFPRVVAGELLHTPENDDWAKIGWSMAYIRACNDNYSDWRSTRDKVRSMYESGEIKDHQYKTFTQMTGRTAGAKPRSCSMTKNAETLRNINRYLDRIQRNTSDARSSTTKNEMVWTNRDGKLSVDASRKFLTLEYESPYVDKLVRSLKDKKTLEVALILSEDSYSPKQYEFTFVDAQDVVVRKEGNPDILEIGSADIIDRIVASREDGLYVYLAARNFRGEWAWARFRP